MLTIGPLIVIVEVVELLAGIANDPMEAGNEDGTGESVDAAVVGVDMVDVAPAIRKRAEFKPSNPVHKRDRERPTAKETKSKKPTKETLAPSAIAPVGKSSVARVSFIIYAYYSFELYFDLRKPVDTDLSI